MIKKLFLILIASLMLSSCTEKAHELSEDELIINEGTSVIRLVAEDSESMLITDNIKKSLADALFICYEPLFDMDEAMNPVGVLAKSVKKQSDTSYLVNLKSGVKWHFGGELSPSDIEYTIRKIKEGNNHFSDEVKKIKSLEILDDKRVVFNLYEPCANFEALLTFPIIKNGAYYSGYDFVPEGTGPYKYSKKENNALIFEANHDYHESAPSDKSLSITLMKDKDSAVFAFEASELDVISSTMMDISKISPKGNIRTISYLSDNLTFLGLNNDEGLLQKSEIRRAISYIIDKEKIIKENYFGYGRAVDVPVYPIAWFYNKEDDSILVSGDDKYLQKNLELDGWFLKNGYFVKDLGNFEAELTFQILVNKDNPEKVALAEAIQKSLAKNGIRGVIKKESYEEYLRLISADEYFMFIGEVSMPKNMDLSRLLKSGKNYFNYENSEMDKLLAELGGLEGEELSKGYSKICAKFLEDVPFVPLFFKENVMIMTKNLAGYGTPTFSNPYRNVGNWYFTQRIESE